MNKRSLFAELSEGFEALAASRTIKRTLKITEAALQPHPEITPEQLITLREKLHLSRTALAHCLRTNPRTLENWEQGRAKPNPQAALLIRLVERYPDTMERLGKL